MRTPTSMLLLATSLFVFSCQKGTKGDEDQTQKPSTAPVATAAGTGVSGFADGPIAEAKFNQPKGIAIDATGNLYVADWGNNRIRKIMDGMVTTIAGSGPSGYVDASGTAARFNRPRGVAVDKNGNVYIADTDNNRIRKISPEGVVTTVAGNGKSGYVDATGTAAEFNHPRDIAVDAQGNFYIADTDNNRIRKVSPDGVVTTIAGNGTAGYADGKGTEAQFGHPRGVTVDQSGNVYVADTDNSRIRKITTDGTVSTFAGNGTAGYADGSGSAVKFKTPKGLTVDKKGNVYVADTDNNRIRKITPAGVVTTVAGNGKAGFADGTGLETQFYVPRSLTVDADGKNLYIVDQNNNRIRKIAVQ